MQKTISRVIIVSSIVASSSLMSFDLPNVGGLINLGGGDKSTSFGEIFGGKISGFSGSLAALKYGCQLADGGFSAGIGNFSLGDLFKSIDLGFIKCNVGVNLDKATCKNSWFDEAKRKAYGKVDEGEDALKDWGQEGLEWLEENVLDYKDDKSGIWGYGKKAREVAKNYCQVVDDKIWGNKGGGRNPNSQSQGQNSVVAKKAKKINNQNADNIILNYVYGNTNTELKKYLANSLCMKNSDEINIIRDELVNRDYNPAILNNNHRATFVRIAKECLSKEIKNNTGENVAGSMTAALQMTSPNVNGSGTDATYSNMKTDLEILNQGLQKKIREACNAKATAGEYRDCYDQQMAHYKSEMLSPAGNGKDGAIAKMYKDADNSFNEAQRVIADLKSKADPNGYAPLETMNGRVSLTDNDRAEKLMAIKRNNAKKTLEAIRANELMNLKGEQMRLHIESAVVASETFDKQASIQETSLIVSKSQELAKQTVQAILGN